MSDLTARLSAEVERLVASVAPLLTNVEEGRALAWHAAASAVPVIVEDLEALAARDTAARGGIVYVYSSYLSFWALLAHRVAHAIHRIGTQQDTRQRPNVQLACAARRIAEDAKVRTGVDIHPAARIGHRMVIDHGWGTVIGEQARVGDDCYFLQNVTLGCRRIGTPYGSAERRHPTVGDRVVLAGDVWVFGPVTIGDDCRIDPGARITTDIPAGSHVRVMTKLQVTQMSGQLAPTGPSGP
jgi:serine O-acetyltransferase